MGIIPETWGEAEKNPVISRGWHRAAQVEIDKKRWGEAGYLTISLYKCSFNPVF